MFDNRHGTVLLGLTFLALLTFSYFASATFFKTLNILFHNQFLVLFMIFAHNILAVSLIIVGMTFYVNLVVLNFFKREKYAYTVLKHPRTFAILFAFIILFLSILRGISLFFGGIIVEALPLIFLVSAPIGIIEGYGIYLTIKNTLSRNITTKDLVYIYGIFFFAAVMEVIFINLLTHGTAL